jgi:hypothetical protein
VQDVRGRHREDLHRGEINVLDSGGFGTVTITKSITIDGAGAHASILSSGISGVTIRIPESADDPNRRVVLRNLSINGTGSSGSVGLNTGIFGVRVVNEGAETVELENVRIANFTQGGVLVAPNVTSPAQLNMSLDNVFVLRPHRQRAGAAAAGRLAPGERARPQ